MIIKEAKSLEKGDFVLHSRYGVCRVKENKFSFGNWFGVIIMPIHTEGMGLLHSDSKVLFNCLLEHSLRCLKMKTTVHKMPKFVFANDPNLESYGLYEWQEDRAGELDENGNYCFRKISDFPSREEAFIYKEKQRKGTLEDYLQIIESENIENLLPQFELREDKEKFEQRLEKTKVFLSELKKTNGE